MCGRFVSTSAPQDLVELFGVTRWSTAETLAPSWNVAPTDPVWAVLERVDRETGEIARQLRPLRWGLVPSWAKDPGVGARMINARAETVHEKPAFKRAFAARRCLVPADGYYEWVEAPAVGGRKAYRQPYFLSPPGGEVLAMAGLYEFWRDESLPKDHPDAWLTSTAVITTDATDAAGHVHDRMPLVISPDDQAAWLDPEHTDTGELRRLLRVPADGNLLVRPVSTEVNSVRNNGPQLVEEIPDPLADAV